MVEFSGSDGTDSSSLSIEVLRNEPVLLKKTSGGVQGLGAAHHHGAAAAVFDWEGWQEDSGPRGGPRGGGKRGGREWGWWREEDCLLAVSDNESSSLQNLQEKSVNFQNPVRYISA